jgi:hypothetical protein
MSVMEIAAHDNCPTGRRRPDISDLLIVNQTVKLEGQWNPKSTFNMTLAEVEVQVRYCPIA